MYINVFSILEDNGVLLIANVTSVIYLNVIFSCYKSHEYIKTSKQLC